MSTVRIVSSVSPSVARRYPGSTITIRASVYVDDALTNASAIAFKWKMGRYGCEQSATPSNAGTGLYDAELTPEQSGDLYYRWDTEGDLDTAQEGVINIAPTQFAI
jgi:hypothetical protein